MSPIAQLPSGVPQLMQSTISLPTYPSILAELIHNAIDAEATLIDCWINPCGWTIRVTDNGYGIDKDELKGGLGCERGMTSKRGMEGDDSHSSGYRGQALASMGTIALLEIVSRRQGFATTYHKTIKNGKALSCGPTEKYARTNPGTTAMVKDLYHSFPVRRNASKGDSVASTVQTCTKLVESIILSFASNPSTTPKRPDLTITLTLEGDVAAGIPSKRILSVKSCADLIVTFGNIFGSSLTMSSKSFRASARGINLRGFLSFTGHHTKAHQYLFVNGHRISQSGIYDVVREVYRSANVLVQEMDDDEENQPRNGNRGVTKPHSLHPVFLLHIRLPKQEIDHGLDPLKSSVLFKDEALVQKVVKSALKNVLKSAGYSITESTVPPYQPRSESVLFSVESSTLRGPNVSQPSFKLGVAASVPFDSLGRYSMPVKVGRTGSHLHGTQASETSRPEWLSKALSDRAQQAFPTPKAVTLPRSIRTAQPLEQKHDCGRADGSIQDFGLGGLQLSQSDLRNAKVVAQIDDKFICCAISSNVDPRTTVLVLVDQHAADERVRVERFLGETLREFENGGVTATSLEGDAHVVQLSMEQHDFLVNHPEISQLLERWGFCVSSIQSPTSTDNANLSVNSVPTLLLSRLGAKGAKDVNKVISGYIAFLQTQPIGAITSLVNTRHAPAQTGLDTTGLLRWMPRRMKELVNSKACRGAFMFNDPLTMDKCDFLIQQLGQTSFPFICAHGRPSIFPLVRLAQPNTGRGEQVDWEKQSIFRQE